MASGSVENTPAACAAAPGKRSARGHRHDLPEVTFVRCGIAAATPRPQHAAMTVLMRTLLQPMNLAAVLSCLAVALALRADSGADQPLVWMLVLGYLLALLGGHVSPRHRRRVGTALVVSFQADSAPGLAG